MKSEPAMSETLESRWSYCAGAIHRLIEMDGELVVLEQTREKTRALNQDRMQEHLTGRIRLPKDKFSHPRSNE
jgi:hypothetical protein